MGGRKRLYGEEVDIGAHEFNNDPPTLEFPDVSGVLHNVAKFSIQVSGEEREASAKLYLLVAPTSAKAPSRERLLDDGKVHDLEVGTLVGFNVPGLRPSTEYKIYYLVKDSHGNTSDVLPSESFTTLQGPTTQLQFSTETTLTSSLIISPNPSYGTLLIQSLYDVNKVVIFDAASGQSILERKVFPQSKRVSMPLPTGRSWGLLGGGAHGERCSQTEANKTLVRARRSQTGGSPRRGRR